MFATTRAAALLTVTLTALAALAAPAQPDRAVGKAPGDDKTLTLDLGRGAKMEFVRVRAGKFLMGSPANEQGRYDWEKQHEVEITKDYYLGKYEVTQEQYEALMGENPSWFSPQGGGAGKVKGQDTAQFPVESVPWKDAVTFCERLAEKSGKPARLPTEAEWEYACRAGSKTAFHWGDESSTKHANLSGLHRTAKVGTYEPNAWGLYDMHGNVAEWCQDWYVQRYYDESPKTDPQGPEKGSGHVVRGGNWFNSGQESARSAYRTSSSASHSMYGFRVCIPTK
jgi:formylglycine-generating enzyme required for sulfatase activity